MPGGLVILEILVWSTPPSQYDRCFGTGRAHQNVARPSRLRVSAASRPEFYSAIPHPRTGTETVPELAGEDACASIESPFLRRRFSNLRVNGGLQDQDTKGRAGGRTPEPG